MRLEMRRSWVGITPVKIQHCHNSNAQTPTIFSRPWLAPGWHQPSNNSRPQDTNRTKHHSNGGRLVVFWPHSSPKFFFLIVSSVVTDGGYPPNDLDPFTLLSLATCTSPTVRRFKAKWPEEKHPAQILFMQTQLKPRTAFVIIKESQKAPSNFHASLENKPLYHTPLLLFLPNFGHILSVFSPFSLGKQQSVPVLVHHLSFFVTALGHLSGPFSDGLKFSFRWAARTTCAVRKNARLLPPGAFSVPRWFLPSSQIFFNSRRLSAKSVLIFITICCDTLIRQLVSAASLPPFLVFFDTLLPCRLRLFNVQPGFMEGLCHVFHLGSRFVSLVHCSWEPWLSPQVKISKAPGFQLVLSFHPFDHG